jgi:hypothetical protein
MSVPEIAARAGIGERTVRYALAKARQHGLVSIEERRRAFRASLPNRVSVLCPHWQAWLAAAKRSSPRGGNAVQATDKSLKPDSIMLTETMEQADAERHAGSDDHLIAKMPGTKAGADIRSGDRLRPAPARHRSAILPDGKQPPHIGWAGGLTASRADKADGFFDQRAVRPLAAERRILQADANVSSERNGFRNEGSQVDPEACDHPGSGRRLFGEKRQMGLKGEAAGREPEGERIGEHEAIKRPAQAGKACSERRSEPGEAGFVNRIARRQAMMRRDLKPLEDMVLRIEVDETLIASGRTIPPAEIDAARIDDGHFDKAPSRKLAHVGEPLSGRSAGSCQTGAGKRNRRINKGVGSRPDPFDDLGIGSGIVVLAPGLWVIGMKVNDGRARPSRCNALFDDLFGRNRNPGLQAAAPRPVQGSFDPGRFRHLPLRGTRYEATRKQADCIRPTRMFGSVWARCVRRATGGAPF